MPVDEKREKSNASNLTENFWPNTKHKSNDWSSSDESSEISVFDTNNKMEKTKSNKVNSNQATSRDGGNYNADEDNVDKDHPLEATISNKQTNPKIIPQETIQLLSKILLVTILWMEIVVQRKMIHPWKISRLKKIIQRKENHHLKVLEVRGQGKEIPSLPHDMSER